MSITVNVNRYATSPEAGNIEKFRESNTLDNIANNMGNDSNQGK